MENIITELGISGKNIFPVASFGLFEVVVHTTWLKKWLKNTDVDNTVNTFDFVPHPGESVPSPWKKIFIRVRMYFCNFEHMISN